MADRFNSSDNKGSSDRLPPQDLDAEQATLGAILIEPEAASVAFGVLDPDQFYREAHRIIARAMKTVAERSEPIDLVTVSAELRRMGQLEAVGGGEYLTALMNEVPTAAHVKRYADIVADKAILRQLINIGAEIQGMAYEDPERITDVIDRAEARVFRLARNRTSSDGFMPVADIVKPTWEHLDAVYKKPDQLSGVSTGLSKLDDMTQGIQTSELVIVAGRPSMGKTSLAINNFCLNASIQEGLGVGVFSLEMSKMQLTEMMLCSLARVNSHRLRRGLGKSEDWQRMGDALGRLPSAHIFIDDTPGLPIMELRSKARRLKSQEDIDLLVIDYLQLIGSEQGSSYDSRHQEISAIARALKDMARELNIPIVALSQLSRQVERRVEKRPILSDLAESGSIEAEADLVMLLFRPSYYQQKEVESAAAADGDTTPEEIAKMREAPDDAEIIIAKHRTGPTGIVNVKFDQKYRIFADIDTFREVT